MWEKCAAQLQMEKIVFIISSSFHTILFVSFYSKLSGQNGSYWKGYSWNRSTSANLSEKSDIESISLFGIQKNTTGIVLDVEIRNIR